MSPLAHPKGKTPSRSSNLRKGVLFSAYGRVLLRPTSQSRFARQLPQRGSHWRAGQAHAGRAKHNISEAAVLRCLGQRQLDKERCPEAAVPVSKARPFASCRASVVQWKVTRPAKGSPSGGAGAKRLRGRTRALDACGPPESPP